MAQAKKLGYRSRAYAKLAQIQQKHQIFTANMHVLDCGAAPGSWSQVAQEYISTGRIVAVDLLKMAPLEGVDFIQGDIEDDHIISQIKSQCPQGLFDVVMTDIAPNTCGIQQTDQIRQLAIVESIIAILPELLKPSGYFIAKVFQGVGHDDALKLTRGQFEKVSIMKPSASRKESKEVYWIAKNFAG